jgi:hypothetical protein
MEHWYKKQDFYCEVRFKRIKTWMEQETVDLSLYTVFDPVVTYAS